MSVRDPPLLAYPFPQSYAAGRSTPSRAGRNAVGAHDVHAGKDQTAQGRGYSRGTSFRASASERKSMRQAVAMSRSLRA